MQKNDFCTCFMSWLLMYRVSLLSCLHQHSILRIVGVLWCRRQGVIHDHLNPEKSMGKWSMNPRKEFLTTHFSLCHLLVASSWLWLAYALCPLLLLVSRCLSGFASFWWKISIIVNRRINKSNYMLQLCLFAVINMFTLASVIYILRSQAYNIPYTIITLFW